MTDPSSSQNHPTQPGDSDSDLEQWTRRLTQALQILDLTVDQATLAELTSCSSASIGRTCPPVTTFLVGYAAGLTVANGSVSADEATRRAADVALRLCAEARPAASPSDDGSQPPDAAGWLSTAQ